MTQIERLTLININKLIQSFHKPWFDHYLIVLGVFSGGTGPILLTDSYAPFNADYMEKQLEERVEKYFGDIGFVIVPLGIKLHVSKYCALESYIFQPMYIRMVDWTQLPDDNVLRLCEKEKS